MDSNVDPIPNRCSPLRPMRNGTCSGRVTIPCTGVTETCVRAKSAHGMSQDKVQRYSMKDLATDEMKDLAFDDAIQNRMPWMRTSESDPVLLLTREWLVTNGLGGFSFACGAGA